MAVLLAITTTASASAVATAGREHHAVTPTMVTPGLSLPAPFLALPFSKQNAAQAGGTRNISEGWYYGEERGITGSETHHAIDFNLPYGSPVLAMDDGWAAFTYQSFLSPVAYKGKLTGQGLGLWVLTLHKVPATNVYWWGKYGHLSAVAPGLKYLRPSVDSDGDWHEPSSGPDNLYVPDPQLTTIFTPIHRGQILGYVGDTGIEWGYRDAFNVDTGTVTPRDRVALPAWDKDAHVHIEIYRRVNGSPAPGETFDSTRISVDPFGQYGQVRRWENYSSYDDYPLGPGSLWLTDQRGKPVYAG